MMMVQSVVSGLVRQRPGASPAEIVPVLNAVLFDNVRNRLRQDEHVTFTLLRLSPDGRATFAGAHEDMILCRAGAGAPELVRSPGTWLGAVPDVARATVDASRDLRPGDRLVLYTDGLTEATSAAGEMFGLSRLVAAVEASRAEPIDRMLARLLDAVRVWAPEQADDRTLVVLAYVGA
jgi:serine phosphatase RsbU (regulator of sigma subunit)